jgi:hypothetical protein
MDTIPQRKLHKQCAEYNNDTPAGDPEKKC